METLNNLNKVGSFFFFVFAAFYVVMALLYRNGFQPEALIHLMRLLDLPLAFVALLYGGSSLGLQMSRNREAPSIWVMVLAFLCLGLFTTLLVVQVTVPGQI